MTNGRRADAAHRALSTFTQEVYGGRSVAALPAGDVFTAVYDLVADLGHFYRRYVEEREGAEPASFDEILRLAKYHYDAEASFDWDEEE